MNTAFYQKKNNRKWTWESPDGRTRNMIDLVLVNNRWKSAVTKCRTFSGPDIASDHKLVMAGFRIKLKKTHREAMNKRFDIPGLREIDTRREFNNQLHNRWEQNKKTNASTTEEIWKEIRTAFTETAQQVLGQKNRREKKPWITKKVLEMSDERRNMKKERKLSEENRKKYNKITRLIKKKAKNCKKAWLEEKCSEIENNTGGPNTGKIFQTVKEICGSANTRLITVKSKEGKLLNDKKEIKQRWKQYYEELYNNGNPVDRTVIKELPIWNEHEKMESILREEIEMAIKNLKTKKAPGEDNITAEMIQAGGDCSTEMLHTLYYQIYRSKECPKDWGKAIIVPIHKKGDKTECNNYRAISLLSIPGKVYTKVIQQRLRRYVEQAMSEEQAGFRKGRSTINQIFVIRQISEKYIEKNRTLYNNFIDYKQAFDSVWQEGLWRTLRYHGIPEELVVLIEDLYRKSMSAVRLDGELTEWFEITVGVKQGCRLSSDLFNLILEVVMRLAKGTEKPEEEETGIRLNGKPLNNLRFADDIDLMADSEKNLQELTDKVNNSSKRFGLKINEDKTKTMIIGKEHIDIRVKLEGKTLEQVTKFVYLGGLITEDGRCTADIRHRIILASAVFGKLDKIWKAKNISTRMKMRLYNTLVKSVLLYGSECWCLRKEDEKRLLVAEMSWLRRIRGRSRREKIRNEITRKELGAEETVIDRIRKGRLKWFGHIERMNNNRLPIAALHGHVEGERSRGGQHKTWMDNIREDMKIKGIEMTRIGDTIRNRRIWRNLIEASSSVAN